MIEGYEKLPNGVVKQSRIFDKLMTYDNDYIHTYEGFGEMGIRMSYLRLGNIIGTINYKPMNLLDVGYGNGDFLKVCVESRIESYGTDISGYPVPKGSKFIEWDDVFNKNFNVITFFDALEHFEDISFVKNLKCDYLVITVPEYHDVNDKWFKNWKHRKPDEHLWHFSPYSLRNFMNENGFKLLNYNNVEDIIRKPEEKGHSNILTAIFRKDK